MMNPEEEKPAQWELCEECLGEGKVVDDDEDTAHLIRPGVWLKITCPVCDGLGEIEVKDEEDEDAAYEAKHNK